MASESTNTFQMKVRIVESVAYILFKEQELSKSELCKRCPYNLDSNRMRQLVQAGVLECSGRGRYATYKLKAFSAKILAESKFYASRMQDRVKMEYNISRRAATMRELNSEIKRLKSILDEHNIKY